MYSAQALHCNGKFSRRRSATQIFYMLTYDLVQMALFRGFGYFDLLQFSYDDRKRFCCAHMAGSVKTDFLGFGKSF